MDVAPVVDVSGNYTIHILLYAAVEGVVKVSYRIPLLLL